MPRDQNGKNKKYSKHQNKHFHDVKEEDLMGVLEGKAKKKIEEDNEEDDEEEENGKKPIKNQEEESSEEEDDEGRMNKNNWFNCEDNI